MSTPPIVPGGSTDDPLLDSTLPTLEAIRATKPIVDSIAPDMSILSFMNAISTAKVKFQNSLFEGAQLDPLQVRLAFTALAEQVIQLTTEALQLLSQTQAIFTAKQQADQFIDNVYNSANTQLNTLTQAVNNDIQAINTAQQNVAADNIAVSNAQTLVTTDQANVAAAQIAYNNAVSGGNAAEIKAAAATLAAAQATLAADQATLTAAQGQLATDQAALAAAQAQYTTDATNYNTFFNTAGPNTGTSTFAQAISDYNTTFIPSYDATMATIPALNQARAAFLLKPLDPANQDTPPVVNVTTSLDVNTPPASQLPYPVATLPDVVSILPYSPPDSDILELYKIYTPILLRIIQQINPEISGLTQFVDTLLAIAQTGQIDVTVPAAYIEEFDIVFFSGTQDLPIGYGMSLITAILGLNSRVLSSVLSNSLMEGFDERFEQPLSPKLRDQVLLYTLNVVSQEATIAAVALAQNLSPTDAANEAADNPEGITTSLELRSGIHDLVNSGIIHEDVASILASTPEFASLSPTSQETATNVIAAIVSLSLLKVSLLQVGVSVGAPGLPAQVLAGTSGAPPLSSVFAPTAQSQLNSVLDNPVKVLALKRSLTSTLAATGAPNAARTVNSAVNIALLGTYSSEADFQKALAATFSQQGTSATAANQLATSAVGFIHTENNLPFLSTAFLPATGAALSQSLATGNPNVAGISSVQGVVLQRLLAQGQTNPQLVAALNTTLQGSYHTVRDFYNALSNQLSQTNVAPVVASRFANQVAQFFAPPASTGSQSPLLAAAPTVTLPADQLAGAVTAFVGGKFAKAVGGQKAKKLADQIVQALISSNSIQSDINNQLQILRANNQQDVIAQFYKDIARITPPNIPVYVFKQSIDRIVQSLVTSYLYPDARESLAKKDKAKEPITFKRDIDIPA